MRTRIFFLTLLVLGLLMLPALAEVTDDFGFDTATGTLTAYTGSAESVEIPREIDGVPVKSIGNGAFSHNRTLTSVVIPDGVEVIGDDAFAWCDHLEEAVLPDSVRVIGANAFVSFRGHALHWPAELEEIGEYAFPILNVGTELYLPQKLRVIGDRAFQNAKLRSVYFPTSVERIGAQAFADTAID